MNKRSLSLEIKDSKDNEFKGQQIQRTTNYTTLKKGHSKSITDYVIRAQNAATTLNAADEVVSDSLLVAIVSKEVLDDYTPFLAVITQ